MGGDLQAKTASSPAVKVTGLVQCFRGSSHMSALVTLVLRRRALSLSARRLEGRPQAESRPLPSFETVTRSKLRVTSSG
jgi:hypothetical protein